MATKSSPFSTIGTTWFDSPRGQKLLENLTAYLFLAPAALHIFIFGLFPVAFAFFVSLHRWRRFPDEYRGLDQYVEALGGLAYVVFFWLALGGIGYGLLLLYRLWKSTADNRAGVAYLLPGILNAAALLGFTNWFFVLLPFVLNVPVRLRGLALIDGIFVREFFNSFTFPEPLAAATPMWALILAALVVGLLFAGVVRVPDRSRYLLLATLAPLALASGALILQLTLSEIQLAIEMAQAAGEALPLWSNIILISAGVGLLFAAYQVWQRAVRADADRNLLLLGLATTLLAGGGYLLIAELPPALASADKDVLRGFNISVMYSLGTVPFQLAISLGLAVLLFQNIRGKGLLRVIYFMPYITPFVATSVVFSLLFSHRPGSPANQLLTTLGIETQNWLLEPKGINLLLFGEGIPAWLAGPGLALIVIMIYNTWVYAGYSTVIFLAGLGNIPKELYEAAKIDGASGWQSFRFITLPLLSPTTFFLILIATIGTFQAFTQIFLLRRPGALDAVDTINISIFERVSGSNPDYAYGSAMAFVLFAVILILTLAQNRIAARRVFYG
ncbi:MAG: sugar ABC transporter permease [Armatimonadetes bacterium]|nr:sugar ABC transporter permease [Anaerolineae bacterium]